MKNKNGFTLIELLVVIVIIGSIGALVLGGLRGCSNGEDFTPYTYEEMVYPEQETARTNREIAEEMRRANDLKEQELRQNRKAEGE